MKSELRKNKQLIMDSRLLLYLANNAQVYTRLHAFIYLLENAVEEPTEIMKRGISVRLAPGQLEASIIELSTKWGWHRRTVSSFLDELESSGYIKRVSSNVSTVIEITCWNQCTTEPVIECISEFPTNYTADYRMLPGVAHQDPPMQLPEELRLTCRRVYDLFIETFPLLDKPEAYSENIEKDIYYVFILGMKGNWDCLKQYFGLINADPMKNGTIARETDISSCKESFGQLFSANWQLVFDNTSAEQLKS